MAIVRPSFEKLSKAAILAAIGLGIAVEPSSAQEPPSASSGSSPATSRSSNAAASPTPATSVARNPLDPLEPAEIQAAVNIVRKEKRLPDSVRFVTVSLNEPPKELVLHPRSGSRPPREAFLILLDNATGRGYEAIVDLSKGMLGRYEALPVGVQPPIMLDEFGECEEAARRSPAFREACEKRGIKDLSLVMIDAWSAGHYGNEPPEDRGKRLCRALCWVRAEPSDNGYARPIENLIVVIDLNRKEVVRVEDYGAIPLPPQAGNWARQYNKETRADLKPLDVTQSDGPSFAIRGHEVSWQKWDLRVGFNPREGLVLYTVRYDGRPVLYRASISEMIVPYADPKIIGLSEERLRPRRVRRGDDGQLAGGRLRLPGHDPLLRRPPGRQPGTTGHDQERHLRPRGGFRHPLEAHRLANQPDGGSSGSTPVRFPGRHGGQLRLWLLLVLLPGRHDPDGGQAHGDHELDRIEARRDAALRDRGRPAGATPRITSISSAPASTSRWTERPIRSTRSTQGPYRPAPRIRYGNAFFAEATPLLKELEARRSTNPLSSRFWRIVNPGRKNSLGQPVAYRLCPGENVLPFAQPGAAVLQRGGFLTNNLWVTPYDPKERYPTGEYPNQNPGGDGLPRWTKADREIAGRDLVVWYNFGQTHIPRVEDWPVMPVSSVGFLLRPDGFFDRNPAMDLPAPSASTN